MLVKKLKKLILEQGYLPLDQFLSLVIPYYYQHNTAIGKSGDFITAPEVSQLFGEVIAIYIGLITQNNSGQSGKPVNLIELGPGRGTLMADVLRGTIYFQHLSIEHIHLMEISETMRQAQQNKLSPYQKQLTWFEDINNLPAGYNIIIANEFFDALPIKQYKTLGDKVYEVGVTIKDDKFSFIDIPTNLPSFTEEIIEICPSALEIANQLAIKIKTGGGLAIIIDYGYILKPNAYTLQALYKHQYIDPLQNIGNGDITALVDFSVLQQIFNQHGLHTEIISQATFLKTYGIDLRAQQLAAKGADVSELNEAIYRLTAADQMGELFKVLLVRV